MSLELLKIVSSSIRLHNSSLIFTYWTIHSNGMTEILCISFGPFLIQALDFKWCGYSSCTSSQNLRHIQNTVYYNLNQCLHKGARHTDVLVFLGDSFALHPELASMGLVIRMHRVLGSRPGKIITCLFFVRHSFLPSHRKHIGS